MVAESLQGQSVSGNSTEGNARAIENTDKGGSTFQVHVATIPADSDEEKLNTPVDVMHPLPADFESSESSSNPNTIQGICVDENGRPLPGVSVEVFSRRVGPGARFKQNAQRILTTRTDQQGEFRFVDVVNIDQEFPEGIPEDHFEPRNKMSFTIVGRTDDRAPERYDNLASMIAKRGVKLRSWLPSKSPMHVGTEPVYWGQFS